MTAQQAITKPRTTDSTPVWQQYGFQCGQDVAAVEPIPGIVNPFRVSFELDYFGAAVRVAMRRSGFGRITHDRQAAFNSGFREGFVRGVLSRLGVSRFALKIGAKNIALTPEPDSPFWTIRYLDGALDPQAIHGVLDPFAEIATLQAQGWPAQVAA